MLMIDNQAHERPGVRASKFAVRLLAPQSDLVNQALKTLASSPQWWMLLTLQPNSRAISVMPRPARNNSTTCSRNAAGRRSGSLGSAGRATLQLSTIHASHSSPVFHARRLVRWVSSMAACAFLTACGGSDPTRETVLPEDAGSVRYLSQLGFRGQRLLLLIAFEGGLTYGFYQFDAASPDPIDYAYAGVFIARRPPSPSSNEPASGLDFNFEQGLASQVTLALAPPNDYGILLGRLMVSSIRPPANTPEIIELALNESPNSKLDTNSSRLAGTFAAQGRSLSKSLRFPATIENGQLSAKSVDGCEIDAKLVPRLKGNLYDVKASLGAECALGSGDFTGHALQDYLVGNVFVFLQSSQGAGAMLLLTPA